MEPQPNQGKRPREYEWEKQSFESAISILTDAPNIEKRVFSRQLTHDQAEAAVIVYRNALEIFVGNNEPDIQRYLTAALCAYLNSLKKDEEPIYTEVAIDYHSKLTRFINILFGNMPLDLRILAVLMDATV